MGCEARPGRRRVGRRHAEALHGSPGTAREARAAFDSAGIAAAVHARVAEADGLEDVCPFAAGFGAGLIVVHCPYDAIAADLETQASVLRRWRAWCLERGVTLTV
ncbi:MAG: hypothetical protein N3A38_14710 [Planctomycetota bacterium]|nr:hypothetical protein [Planctomycetota bacterium]